MKNFISKAEMNNYGYIWDGMIPFPGELAKKVWFNGCLPVYMLYKNDSEAMIDDFSDFKHHSENLGMFGIERNDLKALIPLVKELETYKEQYEGGFNCVD